MVRGLRFQIYLEGLGHQQVQGGTIEHLRPSQEYLQIIMPVGDDRAILSQWQVSSGSPQGRIMSCSVRISRCPDNFPNCSLTRGQRCARYVIHISTRRLNIQSRLVGGVRNRFEGAVIWTCASKNCVLGETAKKPAKVELDLACTPMNNPLEFSKKLYGAPSSGASPVNLQYALCSN